MKIGNVCVNCRTDKICFVFCSQDLAMMCRQLNMEDAVEEIMVQLGADDSGRISFDEFLQCRMRLITEIEQERLKERGLASLHPAVTPWPTGKLGCPSVFPVLVRQKMQCRCLPRVVARFTPARKKSFCFVCLEKNVAICFTIA